MSIPIQKKGFLWDFSVFSQLVIRRPEFEWDMMSMWQRFDGDWLGNSGLENIAATAPR